MGKRTDKQASEEVFGAYFQHFIEFQTCHCGDCLVSTQKARWFYTKP